MGKQLTFEELENKSTLLFYQGEYIEDLILLEKGLDRFPDQWPEIAWNLAYIYIQVGKHNKALDLFEEALEKEVFFPFYAQFNLWEKLEKIQGFQKLKKEHQRLREEAQAKARPHVEIRTPGAYKKTNKKYPLFIALHGGGGSIEFMKRHWKSDKLAKEFIVAIPRSSQVVNTGAYIWDDFSLARKEIKQHYERIIKEYRVNMNRVFIGGFSQGGKLALDVVFNEVIPVYGFVALCPGDGIPDGLTEASAAKLANQGARGIIITGDKDQDLEAQKEMEKIFEFALFPFGLKINPGMYHWFPEDFGSQLDHAIEVLF